MPSSNETITIQVGNTANYLGSHLWNSRCASISVDDDSADELEDHHHLTSMLYHSSNYNNNTSRRNDKQLYYPRCIIVESASNLASFDALLHRKASPTAGSSSIFSRGPTAADGVPWAGKIQTSYHSSISTPGSTIPHDMSNEDIDGQHSR